MKRIIIILVSFLLFSTNVLSQNLNQNEQIHRCKVVRIRDVGKAHAISINCDCDSTGNYYMYMIISLKTDSKEGLKIKKGQFYDFTFQEIDGYYQLISDFHNFTWELLINNVSVRFNNTKHYQSRRFILSPCIEGLYYKGCK